MGQIFLDSHKSCGILDLRLFTPSRASGRVATASGGVTVASAPGKPEGWGGAVAERTLWEPRKGDLVMRRSLIAFSAAACLAAFWPAMASASHSHYIGHSRHQPYVNGRLWEGRPVVGPNPHYALRDVASPGPAHYGVSEHDYQRVYVVVGHVVVSIDPWTPIGDAGLEHLEHARIQWLKDHGYVGGVRTFVNEAYRHEPEPMWVGEAEPVKALPTPRATIQLPPRPAKPRFHVEAPMRISVPRFDSSARISVPNVMESEVAQADPPR